MLFVSGHDPELDGRLRYRGRVGGEVTRGQARAAARLAARNALAAARATLGSLAAVRRCLVLTCFVDGTPFPDVATGALSLVTDAFGFPPVLWLRPTHGLAGGMPVEIELLLELAEP